MGKYKRAPEEVIALVEQVIYDWHDELAEARIGILMRAEAPVSKGRATMSKSKKMADDMRAYLDYDFVIWFAADWWLLLTEEQRTALVDHELSHCRMNEAGETSMADHDITEFNDVLARHGFWWPSAEKTMEAVQPHFEFIAEMSGNGVVEAVSPEHFNEADVLDQVGGMFGDSKQSNGSATHADIEPGEDEDE
ncbi:MAG: hypothetical protein IT328_04420 [Caldilineaceae bacterium]|nr:hypothetical protein [Caldilineaceae bacterium]